MKWLIKNPAPSDSRRTKWGDYHFGRSLTKYLERLGHDVETQYDPGWQDEADCDVVLVLRGKYAFPPSDIHHDALRVMWNISHPAEVTLAEYETFDLIFVASRTWADQLQTRITSPVEPLLQCTDLEEFATSSDGTDWARKGFVFIGNTRNAERPAVTWALDYGLPLRIWGRGWDQWSAGDHVVGDYYPNEELGMLYSESRMTLNDHWEDMKEYGFINNRTFDALASGLPVISDWHEELHRVLPEGILFYRDRTEFESCLETLLLRYPHVLNGISEASHIVREQFSFERRVQELCDSVEKAMMAHDGNVGDKSPVAMKSHDAT
jgi:spore maturation protein CgeB